MTLHTSGYQTQHKKLYWDELARLVEQEQQLLRQENERLQREVQNTKGDLVHARDKVRERLLACGDPGKQSNTQDDWNLASKLPEGVLAEM